MHKDSWLLFFKGIPIGISNVLPGISGGTIAIILHIYDTLIDALKDFNFRIILPIGLGAFLGLIATASLVNHLLDTYPVFMTALIFGLIIASAKVTIVDVKKISFLIILSLVAGFFIAFILGSQSPDSMDSNTIVSTKKVIFSGIFASISMLLPGISGATVLVLLGMYEFIIEALLTINIPVILIFSSSAVFGILALAWVLSYLLKVYRPELMSLLTGLIIGSALLVIPKDFSFLSFAGMILGVAIVILLSNITKN